MAVSRREAKAALTDYVATLSPAANRRLTAARLVTHRTTRSLYREFLRPIMKEARETDANQLLLGGRLNFDDVVEMIDNMGFWGFAEPSTGKIHCWWKPRIGQRQLMAFVCHELEHVVSRCRTKDEENRCDLTGAIAVRAMQLLGIGE